MKDCKGIEIEIGDRVLFSMECRDERSTPDERTTRGKIMSIERSICWIWVQGQTGESKNMWYKFISSVEKIL